MTFTPPRLARTFVLAALLAGGQPVDAGESAADGGGPARIGDARPALELETLDGDLITGARATARPMIVDFFATWCGPCHSALTDLEAARRAAGGDALFVLVNLGEPADVVRRWAATADLPGGTLVALDPTGTAARRWGARKLPTTFVMDAQGIVRHINRGWGPGYRDRLTRWIREVSAVRPSAPPAPSATKPLQ